MALEQAFAIFILERANVPGPPSDPSSIEIRRSDSADGSAKPLCDLLAARQLVMSKTYIPKVFQVFKRFHGDVAKGEGIGLAIVRRVVERHGGKV